MEKREVLQQYDRLTINLVRDGESMDCQTEIEIHISRCIGEGSTCVTYEGVYTPADRDHPVFITIKELYPNIEGISRAASDHSLNFRTTYNTDEFRRRKKQFEDNIKAYKKVDRKRELKLTIPKLIGVGYGRNHNLYHIYEAYEGKPLSSINWKEKDIHEQLSIIKKLAEFLKLWCDKGYMLLDLSPDNIAYLEATKNLQFIDFDSLLEKEGDRWKKAASGYRVNPMYLPETLYQEICNREDSIDWEDFGKLINETTWHFYLGMQLYAMLCAQQPRRRDISENDIKKQLTNLTKKYPALAQGKEWEEIQELIKKVLHKLLTPVRGQGYISSDELINDLERTIGLLQRAKDTQIVQHRYEILASDLIEKFPAYKYFSYVDNEPQYEYRWENICSENSDKLIDVLILGNHRMRKALLKYLIACLQMNNVHLRIHLFSRDVKKFWKELTVACPLIGRVCKVTVSNGGRLEYLSEELDETLVDRELAEIYLYPNDDSEVISQKCKENHIRYIMLLDDYKVNQSILETISSRDNETQRFFAFLCKDKGMVPDSNSYDENISICPITEESASDALDKELLNKRIFNRGFFVHSSYELGNNPYASRKKLRKDYENSPYYQRSSIRTALHAVYKLVSVGIDPESNDAAWEYYRKVMGHEVILLDQMSLEHRSWTAFMIVNGALRPNGIREIDEYAFKGGMDWKNDTDKEHMIHPCVAASSTKRSLSDQIWDDFDKIESMEMDKAETFIDDMECDELDKISLSLHFIIKARRKEYEEVVEKYLETMKEDKRYRDDPLSLVIDELAALWPALNDDICIYEDIRKWKEAVERAEDCIGQKVRCKDDLDNLKKFAMPFIKISLRHDFKDSDKSIVEAVPQLFLRTDTPVGEKIGVFWVMRYLFGSKQIDLQAALQTEPEKLILLADYQKIDVDLIKYKYECQELLERCDIDTKVEIQDIKAINSVPQSIHVFFDQTGHYDSCIDLSFLPVRLEYVHKIFFNDKTFSSADSDHYVEMLKKRPALSVEEWLCLHDCSVFALGEGQRRKTLRTRDSIILWNIMRTFSKEKVRLKSTTATAWDVFMDILKKWRVHQIDNFTITTRGRIANYSVATNTTDLQRTGLEKALKYLESKGIIENLSLTSDEAEIKVSFKTRHKKLGNRICKICASITNNCKVSAVLNQNKLQIQYYNRQIKIREAELTGLQRRILDNPCHKAMLKQILKMDPVQHGERIIIFRSSAFFENLLSSSELFRAVIYSECSRKRVFDAIVVNTGFEKSGIKYEADIIGIKDNSFYPIIVTDCTVDNTLRKDAIDMMVGLPGKVIYFVDAKKKSLKKEGDRYCCLTLNDVDSNPSGAGALQISDAIRTLIKK